MFDVTLRTVFEKLQEQECVPLKIQANCLIFWKIPVIDRSCLFDLRFFPVDLCARLNLSRIPYLRDIHSDVDEDLFLA